MEVAHVWDESARFSQASAGPALGGAAMAVPRIVETVTSEFKPVENAHEALDDWVLRHTPTQVRVDLAAFEAEHVVRFREHYGRAVDQFYVEFDALVALVDQVNFVDKAAWPPHRALQFVTIAKNLKAFHSSIERLSKGSYQDAITLTRSAYDAFLRVVHISIYCDSPSGALVSKPNKGVPSFNATGLVQDVLRLDWWLFAMKRGVVLGDR